MDLKRYTEIEARLTSAIDAHLATGGQLLAGSFRQGNCWCPLTCLFSGNHPYLHMDTALISEHEMWSFISGFDGNPSVVTNPDPDMKAMGESFRRKYQERTLVKPKPYEEWSR